MVVLRATQKVLKLLSEPVNGSATSDTALGDWYVNRIVIDRRPLLLLVSSTSRLAVVTPARNVGALPERLALLIEERIRRLGVDVATIASEVHATRVVHIGKTADRSLIGQMVDFAQGIPYYLPQGEWQEADLKFVEDKLAETPCFTRVRFARRVQAFVMPCRHRGLLRHTDCRCTLSSLLPLAFEAPCSPFFRHLRSRRLASFPRGSIV